MGLSTLGLIGFRYLRVTGNRRLYVGLRTTLLSQGDKSYIPPCFILCLTSFIFIM